MSPSERTLNWYREYLEKNKSEPTPSEIICQLQMAVDEEKNEDKSERIVHNEDELDIWSL